MDEKLTSLVEGYFDYYSRRNSAEFTKWDAVTDIVMLGGAAAIELVLALVEGAPGPEALAYVAAGPLEDLLCKHGPFVWKLLAVEARTRPRLRTALGQVWGGNRMDKSVYAELRRLYPQRD